MQTQQELFIVNESYENAKRFDKNHFDEVRDILSKRKKETYQLENISGLEIIPNGIKVEFGVIEFLRNFKY